MASEIIVRYIRELRELGLYELGERGEVDDLIRERNVIYCIEIYREYIALKITVVMKICH